MKLIQFNIIILLFFSQLTNAQEKLELVHADSIRGKKSNQGMITIAEGNVHFRQGDVEMNCQKVTWYRDQHKTIFEENVKFQDIQKTLLADKIFYNDQLKIEHAVGNVVLIDSLHKLTSNKAIYYENEERIVADENVVITDDENKVTLYGQYAEYWRIDEYALVTGDPILIKEDSTGREEIRVIGKKMELFDGGQRALVSDSVIITHVNGKAKCNKAEYFKKENKVLLKEEPIVWQNQDQLTGKEIELLFDDNNLRKVIIKQDALVTSPSDSINVDKNRINKILGDEIVLLLEDNALKEVDVKGKATSYYHIFENDVYKGLNKIIGDKIFMYLADGEIKQIIVDSNPGNSSGVFYPPDFIQPDI